MFAHFYRLSPADFWRLTLAEFAALEEYRRAYLAALAERNP